MHIFSISAEISHCIIVYAHSMSFLIKIISFKINIDLLLQKMVNIDSSSSCDLVYCVFSGRVNIL